MGVLSHIEGHLEERKAEAREHFARHLEELAARVRSADYEPVGIAAVVLREDGSRDVELCCDGGLETLALSSSLDTLARSLTMES
jgi:hypothetical protein